MNENENIIAPLPSAPAADANGHAPEKAALKGMQIRPLPPDPISGKIVLEVGPEAAVYFEDLAWFEDQSWAGRWFPFMGKYIAILNKAHVGTGDEFTALRERVAMEQGVDPGRLLIQYIPPDIIIEG
jgi:hypothetical protein